MLKKRTQRSDESGPQTVTDFIKLQTPTKAIQIGFTNQRVSPWAGLAPLIGFWHWHRLTEVLGKVLPHEPQSNNASRPTDTALGFLAGIVSGAKKLAQIATHKKDQVLQELLRAERLPSQSTLSRFFQGFCGMAINQRAFNPLWRWGLERLSSRPGGYTLDLDSTALVHEDHHHAEGIRTGHTPQGHRRCWNPLLGFIAEAKLVCGFWLRPGNTASFNNVVGFTLNILTCLPHYVRIGLVRADAGFCFESWLCLLEDRRLPYIVVGKFYKSVCSLVKRQQQWQRTDVPGTEVSDLVHQEPSWRGPRRLILLRHRVADKVRPGGRELFELPGYKFQALITSLGPEVPAIEVWRRYNGRAGCENIIKELDAGFALPQLCLEGFWASEAALSLAVFAYNLCVLFQRHLGWANQLKASTLAYRLFVTAGIFSTTAGVDTVRLSVPERLRPWWRRLLDKLVCPFPNCNAVDPWPQEALLDGTF